MEMKTQTLRLKLFVLLEHLFSSVFRCFRISNNSPNTVTLLCCLFLSDTIMNFKPYLRWSSDHQVNCSYKNIWYFVLFEPKIRYFLFSILWQNLNGKDGGLGLVEVWFAKNSRQTSQYIALQLTDSIKGRKKEKHTLFFYTIHVLMFCIRRMWMGCL